MKIFRGLDAWRPEVAAAVTWGVFDGVHAGHRAVFAALAQEARGCRGPAVAIVFDWHPNRILGRSVPEWLTDPDHGRLDLLGGCGIDAALRVPFDEALAALEPAAFLRDVVRARLGGAAVVLGDRSRFGHGGAGTPRTLQEEAPRLGMRARIVPPLSDAYGTVSSTRIRQAVRDGDLAAAAAGLGRPFAIEGEVVAGAGRGRTLGFPTANLRTGGQVLPPPGVYAGWAEGAGGRGPTGRWRALANLGRRPTFEAAGTLACEIHLDGFEGNLRGQRLAFSCLRRLRDERRFDSSTDLAEQIARDRELLRSMPPPPPVS
ncbi:MAG: riboflavin biosynthesis protein RibF [Planctomycetes bacterium]|nr:riboflavin biosynthesis protein RibF [Planctomycetota bacterium]